MICRHDPNDPNCSSHKDYIDPYKEKGWTDPYARSSSSDPDPDAFEITDVVQLGPHLVLKVRYPNYKNCAKQTYEGNKVMVFLDTSTIDALKWRKIDPHFREKGKPRPTNAAPGPDAQFPASEAGWHDAVDYAKLKIQQKTEAESKKNENLSKPPSRMLE